VGNPSPKLSGFNKNREEQVKAYKAGKSYFKATYIPIIAIFFIFIFFSECNTTEPPINGKAITLKLEDVSCTETWISLTTNLQLPATVILKQDNQTRSTINLVKTDTLLYIDSLLPNKTYSYVASHSGLSGISSNELTVATMDTTSHDFTFETYTFGGQAGTCTLYDVAIIDENNIWAVGEIYLLDSLGQPDPRAYNAVHWDGSKWKLLRLQFYTFCGQPSTGSYPAKSIIAFDENDIWITSGSQITQFDGGKQLMTDCIPVSVNKLWGTDDNNLYAVGVNGGIAHYHNGGWSKIESGTELNIGDIWGIPDGTGSYNKYLAADNSILKIDNNNQLTKINAEPGMIIISIWGKSNRLVYTAGDGVVLYKNNQWEKINRPDINTIYRVRGQNYNDVCGIGGSGSIIYHFNGYSWQSINPDQNNRYWRIDIKGNTIAASGYQGEKAAVTILRRNN
jgi:hypothetical protein